MQASSLVQFDSDYAFFKEKLLSHTIHRPPYSEQIFSFQQMKLVAEYMTHTYFRHYMMYKHVFSKKLRMDFVIENFMPVIDVNLKDVPEIELVQLI